MTPEAFSVFSFTRCHHHVSSRLTFFSLRNANNLSHDSVNPHCHESIEYDDTYTNFIRTGSSILSASNRIISSLVLSVLTAGKLADKELKLHCISTLQKIATPGIHNFLIVFFSSSNKTPRDTG